MGDWTKEFDNSKAALQAFADRVLADARLNLKKKRKPGRTRSGLRAAPRKINASGRLSRSLFWGWSDQKMTLGFGASGKGAKYAYYVEHGRRPGKQPPPRAIMQWIKIKPVRPRDLKTGRFIAKTQANLERMAFLIGRKIGRFGTEATHFYSQAFTKHYNKLDRDLQMKFAEDVEEQVDYSLKKLNIKIP